MVDTVNPDAEVRTAFLTQELICATGQSTNAQNQQLAHLDLPEAIAAHLVFVINEALESVDCDSAR